MSPRKGDQELTTIIVPETNNSGQSKESKQSEKIQKKRTLNATSVSRFETGANQSSFKLIHTKPVKDSLYKSEVEIKKQGRVKKPSKLISS